MSADFVKEQVGGRMRARSGTARAAPSNKLSEAERERVLAIANEPAHASLAPHQIVPRLADQGVYVASESTFYRVLKAANQQHGRGRARRPSRRVVTTHRADGTEPAVVLGHHLVADHGEGAVLLLVHDERYPQPQAGGQRGACKRDIGARGTPAGERLPA
ncbi:MAG: helix-turn-helix domain-containing protein [Gammaproteobacteria bacterium]|nr:helix-turn-helix domain-containing protein [Gammaproteobacteria bacterium]